MLTFTCQQVKEKHVLCMPVWQLLQAVMSPAGPQWLISEHHSEVTQNKQEKLVLPCVLKNSNKMQHAIKDSVCRI